MTVFLSQVLIPTAVASVAAALLLGLINIMRGGNPWRVNAVPTERCRARQAERAGRHVETIGARLAADLDVLRDLHATLGQLRQNCG